MSENGQTHFNILQDMLQDFENVSDHFQILWIKGLKLYIEALQNDVNKFSNKFI